MAGEERVLSSAYPTSVSFNDVVDYATFDEGGFARLVLTPSVRFTGDCTDSEGTQVETTYTIKLLLRDEGFSQTLLLSKGDTVELPALSAGPDMVLFRLGAGGRHAVRARRADVRRLHRRDRLFPDLLLHARLQL